MQKIKIVYVTTGPAPDTEAEIEVQSLRYGSGRIVIDLAAGRQIADLWRGRSIFDPVFHLVDGSTMFVGCGVERVGHDCTISYMRVDPYPPLEPVHVVVPIT